MKKQRNFNNPLNKNIHITWAWFDGQSVARVCICALHRMCGGRPGAGLDLPRSTTPLFVCCLSLFFAFDLLLFQMCSKRMVACQQQLPTNCQSTPHWPQRAASMQPWLSAQRVWKSQTIGAAFAGGKTHLPWHHVTIFLYICRSSHTEIGSSLRSRIQLKGRSGVLQTQSLAMCAERLNRDIATALSDEVT